MSYDPVRTDTWNFSEDPDLALGFPDGADQALRLGHGGSIVLVFGDGQTPYCIPNGPGPDFVVYSNSTHDASVLPGLSGAVTQIITVEVSQNASGWIRVPHSYNPLVSDLSDPTRYGPGLAGITPIEGTGADAAGGDQIDMDSDAIPTGFEACYVRLTDAGDNIPDVGNTLEGTAADPASGASGVDALVGFNPVSPPSTP